MTLHRDILKAAGIDPSPDEREERLESRVAWSYAAAVVVVAAYVIWALFELWELNK